MGGMLPIYNELARLNALEPAMRYGEGTDFFVWQAAARETLARLLGLANFIPCAPKTEIYEQTGYEDHSELFFGVETEPGYFAPCILALPEKPVSEKLPLMICLQGHSTGMHLSLGREKYPDDKPDIESGDRDFAVQALRRGFAALCIEQRCFGIAGGTPRPACRHVALTALLAGRTLIGGRVWDISRVLDAVTDVFSDKFDPAKIYCMGNSGGGTATLYAAALETRIAGAISSCAFCGFERSIVGHEHCACNYVPGVRRYFDMGEIAAMAAPRPLVIVNGKDDPIFPLDGTVAPYAEALRCYRAAGAENGVRHVIGNEGHRFYAADAWPVFLELIGKEA